jgi:hypothetical protein
MTLNPFVMGSAEKPGCFDEQSPCILEQTSMCVIDIAQKKDAGGKFPGQKKYVPWLVCMDSSGDDAATCHAKVGIDAGDVSQCLKSDVQQLLEEYITKDKTIGATPTVHINGEKVDPSFKAIKSAICKFDGSLLGCKTLDPSNAAWQPEISKAPLPGAVIV